MDVVSAPTVAASTASSATAGPAGTAWSAAPCAASASAAVSSPAAIPRRRAAVACWALTASGHAEAGHQVGVDAVELLADRAVGGPPIGRRHLLGRGHRS